MTNIVSIIMNFCISLPRKSQYLHVVYILINRIIYTILHIYTDNFNE